MSSKISWNPWHGCTKFSPGCLNCYVYRLDARFGRDPSEFKVTSNLELPVRKDRYGKYKVPEGSLFMTCFTSDFLLDQADEVRSKAWNYIRERSDCNFLFVTKRVHRFLDHVPEDWGDGWNHVIVYVTVENQAMADYRIPILLDLPIKHRGICVEPMLEKIDIRKYLSLGKINHGVICGGESGSIRTSRLLDFSWVKDLKNQCIEFGTYFWFKQTGTRFKDNEVKFYPKHGEQYNLADRYGISNFNLMF